MKLFTDNEKVTGEPATNFTPVFARERQEVVQGTQCLKSILNRFTCLPGNRIDLPVYSIDKNSCQNLNRRLSFTIEDSFVKNS